MKRSTSITVGATAIAACVSLAVPGGAALAAAGSGARAGSAALPVIKVKMNGKQISVSGALRSGGVRVVSTVTHEREGDPTFIRLHPGATPGQLLRAAQGDPNNISSVGHIVFSPPAHKGTSWAQARLGPGKYVAVDLGPNSQKPPLTTFTITKSGSPATLPKPQARVRAIEFGFRGPGTLHNGELVRFANRGYLVHMIVAARGKDRAGAHQIANLLRAGKDGKAQRHATGFTTFYNILTHGAYQQQVVHVRPGYWVLACFMDAQDGREHTQLGMVRVIHITK